MFDHEEDDFWDDMLIMEMMDEDEAYEEGYEDGYEDGRSHSYRRPHQNTGGCYIATCVYGSYDCPEVWTLRRFRDQFLKRFVFGRLFIRAYYAISPRVVSKFGQYQNFRQPCLSMLSTFVRFLRERGYSDTPYSDEP